MGAFGGHERGWEQVSARLDFAAKGIAATDRSAENIVTTVGEDRSRAAVAVKTASKCCWRRRDRFGYRWPRHDVASVPVGAGR